MYNIYQSFFFFVLHYCNAPIKLRDRPSLHYYIGIVVTLKFSKYRVEISTHQLLG